MSSKKGDVDPKLKCKLFVGGLDYSTEDQGLKEFYEQWGTVEDYIVMKDPKTKRNRGFGFVTYTDPHMADAAMANLPHFIDGRQVDPKRAVPRDMCDKGEANDRKLFIGGLSKPTEKEDLQFHFGQYGEIVDCEVSLSKETGESRGFGFVEYAEPGIAEKVVAMKEHVIKGRTVDVKKAMSREQLRAADRSNNTSNWYDRPTSGRGGRTSKDGGWNNSWGGADNNDGYNYGWGGGWGNQTGNPWNQWGQQGYNMMGGNSGANYSGGYTGGYTSSGGGYGNTGTGQNAWSSSTGAYNSGTTGDSYSSAGRGGGGPMRANYTSNYRSAPYSTPSEGGGYGQRAANPAAGGYTQ